MMTTGYAREGGAFGDGDWSSRGRVVVAIAAIGASVLAGWVANHQELLYVAFFIAAIAGAGVAFFPRILLLLVLVGGLVAAGLARLYLPQLQGVRWLIALGAWVLGCYGLLGLLSVKSAGTDGSRGPLLGILVWAALFFAVLLAATAMNWKGLATAGTGLKGYFQMWGLLLAFALVRWPESLINRLPALLLAIAWLQLPFALHQFLVLVPYRAGLQGVIPVDIVTGTFGGQKDGGGANAVLSAYLLLVIAGVVSAWKEGVLSGGKALLLGLPLLAPIAVNETKIALLYVIVIFLVLFARDIVERPLRFLTGSLVLVGLLILLASAYVAFAPRELAGLWELIEFVYQGNIENEYNTSGELTRWGALEYWVNSHGWREFGTTLFGHGAGMTRVEQPYGAQLFATAADPDLGIGRLGVTAVLWESGVLGLVCVTGLFWAVFRGAGDMARTFADSAEKRAVFRAIQAGVALFYLSFWHKNFFVFHVGYQTVLVLMFGYVLYWQRWHALLPASTGANAIPVKTALSKWDGGRRK